MNVNPENHQFQPGESVRAVEQIDENGEPVFGPLCVVVAVAPDLVTIAGDGNEFHRRPQHVLLEVE